MFRQTFLQLHSSCGARWQPQISFVSFQIGVTRKSRQCGEVKSTAGNRPHKNFASFQSEDSFSSVSIEHALSDTEACAGFSGGAACIAPGIRTVENKKFLCSLDFLVLLRQGKSTNTYILPKQIQIAMKGFKHINGLYDSARK